MVRPLSPVLLACLTLPSAVAGFTTGYYARELQQARNTETYTWLKVLRVYDPWTFQMQFVAGGNPFVLKFVHDGSEKKLGYDEGMIVEYVTFEKKDDGLSVADDRLGTRVHREPATSKFIDWRSQ